MEKETVDGLHLGTVLIILSATLAVGTIIFWYARMYSNSYFESAATQTIQVKTLELESLRTSGVKDVPMASIYSILAREWRAVSDVSVFNTAGTLITTATVNGQVWNLSAPLTKADGSSLTQLVAPEQVLYATAGGLYSGKISGRAYVTVSQSESTKAYSLQVKLQQ